MLDGFFEVVRQMTPESLVAVGVVAYLLAHVGLLLYPVRVRR